MRKYFILTLLLINSAVSFTRTPHWIRHLPKAANNTYYYVVESAAGSTEDAARSKATALVLQRAIQTLGLPYSSKDVEDATRNGKLESMAHEFNIPVSKACEYRQKVKSGGVRVYVLYQVARASNITVQFTPFNDCGSQGSSDTEVSMRPEEWGYYESDQYLSYSSEDQWERGENAHDITMALEKEVRNTLIENFDIREKTLLSMIESKTSNDNISKTAFAIAYIEKSKVSDNYRNYVSQEMETVERQMAMIESRIKAADLVNAKALLDMQKTRLDTIDVKLNFLRAYASTGFINMLNLQRSGLAKTCDELYLSVAGNQQNAREKKIKEFVRNGARAYRQAQIGDALRYYYGAQVLLADLPNTATFMDTIPTPHGPKSVQMSTYLAQQIKDILSNIKIVCNGYYGGSSTEVKLSFYYKTQDFTTNQTVFKAINNLQYTYNDNSGWSEQMPVKDGWSIIEVTANTKPKHISIRLEYRYADEAAFDPELQQKITKHTFSYDKEAEYIVPFVDEQAASSKTQLSKQDDSSESRYESTDIQQNSVVNKVQESAHKLAPDQIDTYKVIIDQLCDAIDTKKYQTIYTLFTNEGYKQFTDLIQYGQARIISRASINFIKIGTDVQCRYIPMEFVFRKGKHTFESVVFTFNEFKKIDGIQFALEERAARNIMADSRYTETSKLVLVNFMENYKTAFALKRLDYIESIFADDAVIITGRVLQRSAQVDANQLLLNNVVYNRQTKEEYISRLRTSFDGKEWINIKFSNTAFEKSAQGEQYGVRLLQDYSSSNYGDRGNLFLLIDCQDQDHPLIRVRVWQAETGESMPFSLTDYDYLTAK